MSALQLTITDAGRAEIINATNTGTGPVEITEVALGTGKYEPLASQTQLQAETKRLNTIAGTVVADDTIHVTVRDESADAYDVSEFGLFTSSGTLFAVYSQVGAAFMQKAGPSALMLSVDIVLGSLDANNLVFGDTNFAMPSASETVAGISKLATDEQAAAGEDDKRVITCKTLKFAVGSLVPDAAEGQKGKAALASKDAVTKGQGSTTIVTPEALKPNLGRLSGFTSVQASVVLTVEQLGTHVQIAQATPDAQVFTLPALEGLESGLGYWFTNDSPYRQTVKANAAENINPVGNTLVLEPFGTAFVFVQQGSQWNVVGDVVSKKFAAALTMSGYQKLPSGLIIQWGSQTESIASAGGGNIVFPIAFPTALLQIADSPGYTGGTPAHDTGSTYVSDSSVTGFSWTSTVAGYTTHIRYIAVGY